MYEWISALHCMLSLSISLLWTLCNFFSHLELHDLASSTLILPSIGSPTP